MFNFILLIIFGFAVVFFALQNSQTIPINFVGYHLDTIPLYVLVLGSLLLGFAVSWLMSLMHAISSSFKIRGKENAIKNANKQIIELTKKVHRLETENERLKKQSDNGSFLSKLFFRKAVNTKE